MSRPLRIAVADDEPATRTFLRKSLGALGHDVVSVSSTGRELVQRCRDLRPDLVVTDIKMPDMDGLDAAAEICADELMPIIVVSSYHEPELIERALRHHIVAYLVKPIRADDLAPAIAIAMRRFEEFTTLRQEAANLRQALEDRKTIERAKGVLMKRSGLDEAEAFRRLQKLASDKRRKLAEIAGMIVVAEEALPPP